MLFRSSDDTELSCGIDSRSVEASDASAPIKTEEQDPFWDSFKASLREEEKPAEAKTPEAPKLDLAAVKEAARPAKSEAPRGRSRNAAPARDEDPGLMLISRRPPQQKFTNFEEYMTAHGGATAPIEDHSEEV